MRMGLEITGFDELMAELVEMPRRAEISITRVLNFAAQSTAIRAKNRIRTGARSGQMYGSHQASAPGEPPANLSGALAASITFTRISGKADGFATAGSDLPYAATLEFGGWVTGFGGRAVYIDARPFLLPSFEEAVVEAQKRFASEFERAR